MKACENCSDEFEDDDGYGYPMCIPCSCAKTADRDGLMMSCFDVVGHSGPCAFSLEEFEQPISDEEIAQAVESIKKAMV